MTRRAATEQHRSEAEAKASFLLRLRAEGIRDLAVLRAMEGVPRAVFAPNRYADLAARDIALPIGCGQTMCEPLFVARVLEALACGPTSRVLEVGAGSGYSTALLGRLAGEVRAVERFQMLSVEARARLAALGIDNAEIAWADGLAEVPFEGLFDRIVIHAVLERPPETLLERLSDDGVLIYAAYAALSSGKVRSQVLIRATRRGGQTNSQTLSHPSRLQPAGLGRSKVL